MKESTIEEHLASLIAHGRAIDKTRLVKPEVLKQITKIVEHNPGVRLREIKDKLPEEITYGQIRIVVAMGEEVREQIPKEI
jgi:ATP-dependent DNA helicase RecQ